MGRIVIETDLDSSGIEKGVGSVRSSLSQLADEYRKSGMDASEAISNAWIDIARQAETQSEKLSKTWVDSFGEIGNAASKIGSVLGKALSGIGRIIGGVGKDVIDTGKSFDVAMHEVKAIMGDCADECEETGATFDKLYSDMTEAAKKAGKETKFTATQSAEALGVLKLSGMSCGEAMTSLYPTLDLAVAGGMELKDAADIVTISLNNFGLEADQSKKIVDTLARVSQKSGTTVSEMGRALKQVGGTANILSGGITEASAAMGLMANSGIRGAAAGTALRNIIARLSAPTDKASETIEELGVRIFNAEGQMRPLNDIFMDFDKTIGGMTDQEKQNVLSNIFNKTDLAAVRSLLSQCGGEFSN